MKIKKGDDRNCTLIIFVSLFVLFLSTHNAESAEHWQSDATTTGLYLPATNTYVTDYIYLDITICNDNSFVGGWSTYFCPNVICTALVSETEDEMPATLGTINWAEGTGTIELEGREGEAQFRIQEINGDHMEWRIDGSAWGEFDLFVYLEFEEEVSNASECEQDIQNEGENDSDNGDGSGCFINTTSY